MGPGAHGVQARGGPGLFAGLPRGIEPATVVCSALSRVPARPTSTEPHIALTIKVSVRSNESLEAAMRRFKRQCNYSGIFRLAKARSWHEKRSDRRRRERRERLRTIQKATRKNDPNRRRRRRVGGMHRTRSSRVRRGRSRTR